MMKMCRDKPPHVHKQRGAGGDYTETEHGLTDKQTVRARDADTDRQGSNVASEVKHT